VEKRDADENGDYGIEGGKSHDGGGTSLFKGGEKSEEADEGEEATEGGPGEARSIPLDFKFFQKQNDDGEGEDSHGLKEEGLAGLGVVGGEFAEDSPESPGDDGHDGVEIPGFQKASVKRMKKRLEYCSGSAGIWRSGGGDGVRGRNVGRKMGVSGKAEASLPELKVGHLAVAGVLAGKRLALPSRYFRAARRLMA